MEIESDVPHQGILLGVIFTQCLSRLQCLTCQSQSCSPSSIHRGFQPAVHPILHTRKLERNRIAVEHAPIIHQLVLQELISAMHTLGARAACTRDAVHCEGSGGSHYHSVQGSSSFSQLPSRLVNVKDKTEWSITLFAISYAGKLAPAFIYYIR
jgi:hypothetical protein